MIIRVKSKKKELAIIIRADFQRKGTEFFTNDDESKQLGYIQHESGHIIKPHIHNEFIREITDTVEVILIRSGKIRIDFYDENKVYIESYIVNEGDIAMLSSGGHGFEIIEDSEIIEIKQGPYAGEKDRTRFEPVGKDNLKIIA